MNLEEKSLKERRRTRMFLVGTELPETNLFCKHFTRNLFFCFSRSSYQFSRECFWLFHILSKLTAFQQMSFKPAWDLLCHVREGTSFQAESQCFKIQHIGTTSHTSRVQAVLTSVMLGLPLLLPSCFNFSADRSLLFRATNFRGFWSV